MQLAKYRGLCQAMPIILLIIMSFAMLFGCSNEKATDDAADVYDSIHDIPGVTEDEIEAVERLREQYDSFTYGALASTEAFYDENGNIRGFTALLCEWLTDLFEIRFTPAIYEWGDLFPQLKADFTGDLTDTEERRSELGFLFTSSIAERSTKYFRIIGNQSLSEIIRTRPLKLAFMEGSTTSKAAMSKLDETSVPFEAFYINDYDTVYNMMKNGEIDAYIDEIVVEAAFDDKGDVVVEDFLPLIYEPVSLSTQNPELEPIINIVQKALKHGALEHLIDIHENGMLEYAKHKFIMRLNEQELNYLHEHTEVAYLAEYANYPVSFYNENEKQWQGIAFDVLDEVSALTGLTFDPIHEPNIDFPDLMNMLENGDGTMISELMRNASREGRFIWPENVILQNDNYVAITLEKMPNISIHRIMQFKVGVDEGTAYQDLFNTWFPNHPHVVVYSNVNDAFDGLEKGEIDILMSSMRRLLVATNYHENPGFKANIVFDNNFSSIFGFNKNEEILCSIVDKALELIDTEAISAQWMRKTFDYRIKIVESQRPWIIGVACLLAFVIILLIILFIKSRREGQRIESKLLSDLEKRTAEAESANNAKTAFLANMSHEIRTPMNSIMGFSELALEKAISPRVKDYLGKIIDGTKWLLRIIDDILDISKIEFGKMELENVPFDLHSIFTRCHSVIHPSIAEKGLDLRVYTEPPIGRRLVGDPVRLYQVLMNLLSNAVKFTNAGTVWLSSSITCLGDHSMTVYFEVKDTGIGMTSEQIERIFEPFVQADSSTTRNFGGTGLGLAITKSIVELMGGKLTGKSEPGAGSTFSFELAFETIEATGDIPEHSEISVIEKPLFESLVLICEDNPMNKQVICEHLDRIGLRTVVAENGKVGLEMVRERLRSGQEPFDLILMDIFMPVMDGVEAASKITALGTGTPIVAMTANVMTNELENYRQNGMGDCISKPFNTQELWRCLLKYLTPVSVDLADGVVQSREDAELQKKLRAGFYKENYNKYAEIREAIDAGDMTFAHRLAHTLKTNAGQIGESALKNAAARVEALLKDGTVPDAGQVEALEAELIPVLEELREPESPIPGATAEEPGFDCLTTEQVQALFVVLEPMLESFNTDCLNLLDRLRNLPGAETLVRQIEDYNFDSALRTLRALRGRQDRLGEKNV